LTYICWSIPPGNLHDHLTEAEARAVIAPWYGLFNFASRGDVIQEQILTEDSEYCAGYLPGECWGCATSIEVVSNFAETIPDMKFDIKKCWWRRIASSCAARLPARPRAPACAIDPGRNKLEKVARHRVELSAAML
jgi:hypothetical protein